MLIFKEFIYISYIINKIYKIKNTNNVGFLQKCIVKPWGTLMIYLNISQTTRI